MEQYRLLAKVFSALGHPKRLRILEYLQEDERCQCELPSLLEIDQSSVSRHVKILTEAGFLRSRKDGTKTMLRVSDPDIMNLIHAAREVTQSRLHARMKALQM